MSRYVFLGTSEIAAAVLEGLCGLGLEPSLVVTPPDRPRGRGRKLAECEAARLAAGRGLPVHETGDVNTVESRREVVAAADGLAVLCDFGQIVGEELLSELLILNVHPSLLPRWRGAAPVERAIMAGDDETGVCIMRLEAGLDTGPIAICEPTEIGPSENCGELRARLAGIGVRLAAEAIAAARSHTLEFTPQPESGATYAEKIDKAERRLDPARPAVELERVVRALTPHIGAFVELEGGERIGVESATVIEGGSAGGHADPGSIEVGDGSIVMLCGQGALSLDRVKLPGTRAMEAAELLRGRELPGDRAV